MTKFASAVARTVRMIDIEKLKAFPTDRLNFLIGLAEAGLKEWKPDEDTKFVEAVLVLLKAERLRRKK